jgi:atypical dual specificity phosphatase
LGRAGTTYRRLRASFTDKPTNFGWIIEGKLAASGLPSSPAQVRWLERHGVDTILTLREVPLPKEFFDGTKVDSIHVRMDDHAPIAQESLSKAVHHVREQVEKGNAVLVHCLAGQGRTGSVIAAYLIEFEDKEPEEAISKLRKDRPGSIERSQEGSVHEYARKVKEKKKPQ